MQRPIKAMPKAVCSMLFDHADARRLATASLTQTLCDHRCWRDDICHSRRSYYRKGRGRVARRNSAIEYVTIPIPDFPYVVLHTYLDKPRDPNDEIVIHAICAELWIGSAPKAMTQPQHTFGLSPRSVKEYARQLLDALYLKYGNGRRLGFERFARSEQHSISQCPVRPCSYHAAHLYPYHS